MAEETADKTLLANGAKRRVSVLADYVDLRDRIYEPALLELKVNHHPPTGLLIRDQLEDGSCVGFALSAVINLQNVIRFKLDTLELAHSSSPRMLYEMAKYHDEWEGVDYNWSSLRGGIKGFFHNGVCSEELAPYELSLADSEQWSLNARQAEQARATSLGAYYRLRPNIIDYHAAINETGALVVSAQTHVGWKSPKKGVIRKSSQHEGGHAFAVVGYDDQGFIIQNSWGEQWGGFDGRPGVAHWSYEDWSENIIDGWVLRLAVPTPNAFDLVNARTGSKQNTLVSSVSSPRRFEVVGHYLHFNDANFVRSGRYASDLNSVRETANLLTKNNDRAQAKYKHLLVFAHGASTNSQDSAGYIRATKTVFKRNGIYPVHLIWETGFSEGLLDVLDILSEETRKRVGGLEGNGRTDVERANFDRTMEQFASGIGRKLWNELKADANNTAGNDSEVFKALTLLIDAANGGNHPLQVHFVGHSGGAILLGEFIKRLQRKNVPPITSCSLLAPACSIDFYESTYLAALNSARIELLKQYCLSGRREREDSVGLYGKSLLHLVSRAFEKPTSGQPPAILGLSDDLQAYLQDNAPPPNHRVEVAGTRNARSDSKTHAGFAYDRTTMNDVLKTILGKKPKPGMGFKETDLIS